MKIVSKIFEYQTKGQFDFRDITDEIKNFVVESNIKNGLLNVQTFHTTATVFVNENEPLLIEDIKANLEKLAPSNIKYNHDNFEIRTVNMCPGECDNGQAHVKALYLPQNVTLNILEGKIQFGLWQRIMFVELDRPRPRKIQVLMIGE
ncbi:MAG: secondary thiamine-phosphate synthase enzyme YjbQ [Candidatus Pacebacteria bacterium]|nr:secondary thiamine-phosphate synthase enzyme YjbQ [Candidatus Paceibacterota bacterium]